MVVGTHTKRKQAETVRGMNDVPACCVFFAETQEVLNMHSKHEPFTGNNNVAAGILRQRGKLLNTVL